MLRRMRAGESLIAFQKGWKSATRIMVQTVMTFWVPGNPVADILEAYPTLNRDQVLACSWEFSP